MASLRHLLDQILIRLLQHPFADRVAGYIAWQRRRKTRRQIEAQLIADNRYPDSVLTGPFAGMTLPDKSLFLDARFEKTFGAYEHELFPLIQSLAQNPNAFDQLINIGAADGFYTVGLAQLFPQAKVLAYEPNQVKTPVLQETARLNHVADRIELSGLCTPDVLNHLSPTPKTLLIVDVDGYEKPLLDPAQVPWLTSVSFLIETHDCFVPGITELLKQRFQPTHQIEEIPMAGPPYASIPPLKSLTMHQVDSMVGSERPNLQSWLWMTPLPS